MKKMLREKHVEKWFKMGPKTNSTYRGYNPFIRPFVGATNPFITSS